MVGVRARRADPLQRKVLSLAFRLLARLLLGIPLTKFSSSFLFRRGALTDLMTTSRPGS